ncbi:glycosyltransferase [Desulfurobacterium crinifex]
MKVLFVVGGLPFGGIENLLFDIALEFLERSVDFKIVNLSGTGEKIEEFLRGGLPVINLGSSKRDIKTFKVKTVYRLRDFIRNYQPNIVHSMQFSGDYFTRIASIGLSSFKIVTHIHNIKRETRIERRIFNKLLSYRTDVFLSVSKEVFEVVEKEHNVAGKPHYVLYNSINIEKFKEEGSLELENGVKYITCVGRLVKQKNFDVAIKAFSLIEKKHHDTRLLIVGEGKEREKLQDLAKILGLAKKIIFTGYRRDVPAILKTSYILLMPSSYEGFPITHLEAMYAGLPAIISPNVPSKEVASECSLIVPIDPRRIANALDRLLADENFYEKLSRKAREIAQEFTIERYVDKLLDFYEGVLSENLPYKVVL